MKKLVLIEVRAGRGWYWGGVFKGYPAKSEIIAAMEQCEGVSPHCFDVMKASDGSKVGRDSVVSVQIAGIEVGAIKMCDIPGFGL